MTLVRRNWKDSKIFTTVIVCLVTFNLIGPFSNFFHWEKLQAQSLALCKWITGATSGLHEPGSGHFQPLSYAPPPHNYLQMVEDQGPLPSFTVLPRRALCARADLTQVWSVSIRYERILTAPYALVLAEQMRKCGPDTGCLARWLVTLLVPREDCPVGWIICEWEICKCLSAWDSITRGRAGFML